VGVKELIDFGMLAEFIGRLPIAVQLAELGPAELLRVLTEPPDALTREYRELLELDEIDLEFTSGALEAIVAHTLERGVGARGLRSTLEQVMAEVLFEAPERQARKVRVDAAMVRARLWGPGQRL
jgi:ATP-dependent Clp protease ATP-binding subunit ClpX